MLVFPINNYLLPSLTKYRLNSHSQFLFLSGFAHRAGQNGGNCTCRKSIEGV